VREVTESDSSRSRSVAPKIGFGTFRWRLNMCGRLRDVVRPGNPDDRVSPTRTLVLHGTGGGPPSRLRSRMSP
jgi:hypothetical protein